MRLLGCQLSLGVIELQVETKTLTQLNDRQINFISASIKDSFGKHQLVQNVNSIVFDFELAVDPQEVQHLLSKLIFIASKENNMKVIFEQDVKLGIKTDPLIELKSRGDVVEIGYGLFLFQGEFLKLFRSLNKYFKCLAIEEFRAIDQENPGVWPIDLFSKVNYLNEFPQHAMLVTAVEQSHENYEKISKKYTSQNAFTEVSVSQFFEPAQIGLQPAVCDTCYYALSGQQNMQNTVYTTYNKVFRNETSDRGSLDRLRVFSVRDIMFIGDKTFVLHTRQRLIDCIKEFLNSCGLKCKIAVADDPFFSGSVQKKLFQHQFELKYEILAEIPFLERWIAIGSINLHLDTFAKIFDIKNSGNLLYSGCIGIGFERILLAFYAQFGCEISQWPGQLQHLLNDFSEC